MVLVPTHLTHANVVLQEYLKSKTLKNFYELFCLFFLPLRKGSTILPSINEAYHQKLFFYYYYSKIMKPDWVLNLTK